MNAFIEKHRKKLAHIFIWIGVAFALVGIVVLTLEK